MANENKTLPTEVLPEDYIKSVENMRRREDGLILLELFKAITKMPPVMWGESIIGYGRYAYKTPSGREGEFLLTGFSPRKSAQSIYIMPGYRDLDEPLSRLGTYKMGKSCLYATRLSNIDMDVLSEIILNGLTYMKENYEWWEK